MIEIEHHDSVTLLRLAHGRASALDVELCETMDATLASEESREATGAIVLTGTGSIFSAGVDLFRVMDGGRDYLERFLSVLQDSLLRLFALSKPTVAAVNGHAIAGGCVIACACDHRIMADGEGRMGVPELRVGVPFPPTPLEVMRWALPAGALEPAMLGGVNHAPAGCLELGLVQELVEPDRLLETAIAAAARLASVPPRTFALNKRLLRGLCLDTIEKRRPEMDPQILEAWCASEVQDAIRAHVERTIQKKKERKG